MTETKVQSQSLVSAQQDVLQIDDLSKKIQDATEELNQLKQELNNLSLEEQNNRLAEIESSIFECSESLEELENNNVITLNKEQLNELKSKVNILKSQKESLKKQIEAQTKLAIDELNQAVTQSQSTEQTQQDWEQKDWKEKKWLWRQREALTSKQEWKENTWKNILRTLWWVWIAAWIWKLGKRIFGGKDYESEIPWYKSMSRKEKRKARKEYKKQKKTERKAEKSENKWEFWQRPFWKFVKWVGIFAWIWSGIYYLAHWLYTKNWNPRDLFDRGKWKKLEFDDALNYVKSIWNEKDNKMSYWMDLKFIEGTSEIEAYGHRFKIDKNKRKIEGLNVNFKNYEHMISAVVLIAYLKKEYSWKCMNKYPFTVTSDWKWDIKTNTWNGSETAVDGTWNAWKVLWISAWWIAWIATALFSWNIAAWLTVGLAWTTVWGTIGYFYDSDNTLNNWMPELDTDNGKKTLIGYLNNMDCWEFRNQSTDDVTESPIKSEVSEVIKEIQETDKNNSKERGARRKLDAIQDPNDSTKYTIKAYDRAFEAKVTWEDWDRKIKILWLSWGIPQIKVDNGNMSKLSEMPLREWLFMSSLIWFLLDEYHHKWEKSPYFKYGSVAWAYKWLYFHNWNNLWNGVRVLTDDKFKKRMPTISNDENKQTDFVDFLNNIEDNSNNISIRKKQKN